MNFQKQPIEGFCSYDQSVELKNLGFDEQCIGIFNKDEEFILVAELNSPYQTLNNTHAIHNTAKGLVCCPMKDQAFKFFREKYKLHGYTKPGFGWEYHIETDENHPTEVVCLKYCEDNGFEIPKLQTIEVEKTLPLELEKMELEN